METRKFEIDLKKIGIGAVKLIVGGAASFGAGYIISKYGKAAISPTEKTLKKVVMLIGAAALSGAAGDVASNYIEKQVDQVVSIGETASRFINKVAGDEKEADDGGSENADEE